MVIARHASHPVAGNAEIEGLKFLPPPLVFYPKGAFLKDLGWARISRGLDPAFASEF